MSTRIRGVLPSTSAREMARIMADEGIGCVLVEQDGGFVGIVTETDLVRKVLSESIDPGAVSAESIMSFPIASIPDSATLETAHEMMGSQRIRHLLVTRETVPVGLISVRSLLDAAYDWALQMKPQN